MPHYEPIQNMSAAVPTLGKAYDLFKANCFRQAYTQFRKLIQQDNRDADVYFLAALSLTFHSIKQIGISRDFGDLGHKLKEMREKYKDDKKIILASKIYQQAVAMNPFHKIIGTSLAFVFAILQKPIKRMVPIESSLQSENPPKFIPARERHALEGFITLGNYQKAALCVQRTLNLFEASLKQKSEGLYKMCAMVCYQENMMIQAMKYNKLENVTSFQTDQQFFSAFYTYVQGAEDASYQLVQGFAPIVARKNQSIFLKMCLISYLQSPVQGLAISKTQGFQCNVFEYILKVVLIMVEILSKTQYKQSRAEIKQSHVKDLTQFLQKIGSTVVNTKTQKTMSHLKFLHSVIFDHSVNQFEAIEKYKIGRFVQSVFVALCKMKEKSELAIQEWLDKNTNVMELLKVVLTDCDKMLIAGKRKSKTIYERIKDGVKDLHQAAHSRDRCGWVFEATSSYLSFSMENLANECPKGEEQFDMDGLFD